MLFTRLFAIAALIAPFVSASPAAPADLATRQDSTDQITPILTTLQSNAQTALDAITATVNGGNVTEDSITPPFNQLIAAFTTAGDGLAALAPSAGRMMKRQDANDIATLVANILTVVAQTLDGLLTQLAGVPNIGVLFAGLDAALNQVLLGLEILLAGVLNLVATLLVDVAALLRNLALGLTLATLGL